jgi:tRNA 2-thiouridine synthesizing protein E
MSIKINDKIIELDNDGFLTDSEQWEPAVAEAMADIDGYQLTEQHWQVITFLRDYYKKYQIAPNLLIMSKSLAKVLSTDKATVKEQLSALFFGSPAITACRYAGLSKPLSSARV